MSSPQPEQQSAVEELPAWDDPATPGAWRRAFAGAVLRLVLAVAALPGLLAVIVVLLPPWMSWLAVLFPVIVLYAVKATGRVLQSLTMRLILRNYPWRQHDGALSYGKAKRAVVTLPDPDNPAKTASPKLPGLFSTGWERAAREDRHPELRYAGDPRFAVVIAVPGLRRLGYASQPTAFDRRTSPRSKGLSEDARRRALAIGARVGAPKKS